MARGKRVDQYKLLETVGEGDVLSVYRAHDTQRNRHVMLKLVHSHLQDDTELLERFQREAKKLLGLRHPHILPVLDINTSGEALYLVMDAPSGESLEQRLAQAGSLEVDDVLFIISPVAEALDYAYEQGVAHHDVRPANIYLDDKTALLTNYRLLEAVEATPVYMSPEQLDETKSEAIDRRSDVYALGCVIYAMLTGRPPFEGAADEVSTAHLSQRPFPPRMHNPDLLPALDAILLKALAKQPSSRYQSAGELMTALHEAVQAAQTRRMTDGGVFGGAAGMAGRAAFDSSSAAVKGDTPTWVWVGVGILLAVVVAVVILLATG